MSNKIISTILEQGIYSLLTFMTGIIIVRLIGLSDYGKFASYYGVLLLASTIQNALIIEPMTINWRKHVEVMTARSYYNWNLIIALVLSIFIAVSTISMLLLVFPVKDFSSIPAPHLFAILSPIFMLNLFTRRSLIMIDSPGISFIIGLFSLIALLIIVYSSSNSLNLEMMIFLLAATNLFATIVAGFFLKRRIDLIGEKRLKIDKKDEIDFHSQYAKWSLPNSLPSWVPLNIGIIFLSITGNHSNAGLLKSILNLISPALNLNIAISNYTLKVLSSANKDSYKEKLSLLGNRTLVFSMIVFFPLIFFGESFFRLLYDKSLDDSFLIFFLLYLFIVSQAYLSISISNFKALKRPKTIFGATLLASVISISLGCVILFYPSLVYATFILMLSYMAMSIYLFVKGKEVIYANLNLL